MATLPVLAIKSQAAKRLKSGHPWIFSNELSRLPKDLEPGQPVDVRDHRGEWIGRGYFNPRSLIAVRILTRERLEIDASWLEKKISNAASLRKRWLPDDGSCRLVFGEADGLPGLIIDRYGPVLVVQFLTAGMDRLTDPVLQVLIRRFQPAAVIARNDTPSRVLEGLPQAKRILHGEIPFPLVMQKNGLLFEVDVWEGQKTGFFLDQAANYRRLEAWAKGARVLDAFCYSGSWGIHAARYGARELTGLDSSDKAIRLARANAERNGVSAICHFHQEDVFDGLRRLGGIGERFDLIILDPPAFAKSRQKVKEAIRGYKEINRQAMRLLSANGILVTCSCSHLISRAMFHEMLVSASEDAKRSFYVAAWHTQNRDHPIVLGIPETDYLNCAVLQVR
jgi:23S rRNA (cytosine1962-C5)-methyltransferase